MKKRGTTSGRKTPIWPGMLKIMAATALYGGFHSAVASLEAKRFAARIFGERNRNGLYRAFYITQSLATFGALAAYAWGQPNRELYHVRRPMSLLMHGGQLGAVLYATWAARQVGVRRITGFQSTFAWLTGSTVPPEPEAQGPALDAEGRRNAIGPFAWSRHPLNFVPVPIFWLFPRMTTNLLAFNLAGTAYLVLGSLHEEARLRRVEGEAYEAYLARGISFYVPAPGRDPLEATDAVLGAAEDERAQQGVGLQSRGGSSEAA